jgi:hypothetical protein
MEQLSPEGLAAVVKDLVTSDLWLNKRNIHHGHDDRQLQDRVLKLNSVQRLSEDHAFAMMHALGGLGHYMTSVFCQVRWECRECRL